MPRTPPIRYNRQRQFVGKAQSRPSRKDFSHGETQSKSRPPRLSEERRNRSGRWCRSPGGANPVHFLGQQERAQQELAQQGGRGNRGGAPPLLTQLALAREDGTARPTATSRVDERPGSAHMGDVIKSRGFEYCAFNPGSSFEGLHESLINYGENKMPEVLTCLHEESSVAMAHGYAKIEGKPMLALLHGTIGVQHAAMAIYNAYGDRVPIIMIAGAGDTAVLAHTVRSRPGRNGPAITRQVGPPAGDHQYPFAQTLQRAYKLAMMPPRPRCWW